MARCQHILVLARHDAACAGWNGAGRSRGRPGARLRRVSQPHDRPLRVCVKGSELSLDDFLQDLVVEGQVGDRPAQPRILLLDLLHPFGLANLQPAILLAPPVVGLLRHADRTHGLTRRLAASRRTSTSRSFAMISSGVDLLPMSQLHI
jgi:hypothetical protein